MLVYHLPGLFIIRRYWFMLNIALNHFLANICTRNKILFYFGLLRFCKSIKDQAPNNNLIKLYSLKNLHVSFIMSPKRSLLFPQLGRYLCPMSKVSWDVADNGLWEVKFWWHIEKWQKIRSVDVQRDLKMQVPSLSELAIVVGWVVQKALVVFVFTGRSIEYKS